MPVPISAEAQTLNEGEKWLETKPLMQIEAKMCQGQVMEALVSFITGVGEEIECSIELFEMHNLGRLG